MATPKLKVFPRPWLGPRSVLNLKRKTMHGRTVTLQERALGSLEKVEARLRKQKIPLIVVQSFRTHAQQKAIYDSGVRPAAPPGSSFHEQGLAVDIYYKPAWLKAIRAAFKAERWYNFSPTNDPGHFSKLPARG